MPVLNDLVELVLVDNYLGAILMVQGRLFGGFFGFSRGRLHLDLLFITLNDSCPVVGSDVFFFPLHLLFRNDLLLSYDVFDVIDHAVSQADQDSFDQYNV